MRKNKPSREPIGSIEGDMTSYIDMKPATGVWHMFPPIESWPLSIFDEHHWRVGYPTAGLSDSRREDLISY